MPAKVGLVADLEHGINFRCWLNLELGDEVDMPLPDQLSDMTSVRFF